MNRIKLLDKSVANRIAAGEVVTNPFSVVKELVENAIDAGAKAITVEIKDGGREYIRVTDNGSGIHPEDVVLAVKKHATSKISAMEDLKQIATLGFRGEALSSIAAVSNLTIKTRAVGEIEGSILTSGQNGCEIKPAGIPDGTTVIVENLFYNLPARLKFLKKGAAEASYISDLLSRLILSKPDISFKYIANGTVMMHSPGTGKVLDAILSVYGKDIAGRIVEFKEDCEDIHISGYISNPNYLFKTTKNQTLLVNGRYVKSKKLSDALDFSFGERLLKGHFPFALLDVRLPYENVDVNVHPSKTVVMIKNEEQVAQLLENAARSAVMGTSMPKLDIAKLQEKIQTETAAEPPKEEITPAQYTSRIDYRSQSILQDERISPSQHVFEKMPIPGFSDYMSLETEPGEEDGGEQEVQQQIPEVSEMVDYRIVGQVFATYILVQSGDILYIIDQHAAHERLNYERLKKNVRLQPQRLLIPTILKLSHSDYNLILKNIDFLNTMAFEIQDFGPLTIKVSALPVLQEKSEAGSLVEDVIEILKRKESSDPVLLKEKIIRRACKTSIKAGDTLSDEEMQELIREMLTSKSIPTCPHGRPVAVAFTKEELEKGFKRRF